MNKTEEGSIKYIVRVLVASKSIEKTRYMRRVEDGQMFRPCSKYESSNRIARATSDNAASVMDDHALSESWTIQLANSATRSRL